MMAAGVGILAEPAIRLRGLSKSYVEGVAVLAGVDLDIPHGQVTALVGANGSGKSTLVKVLSGYHAADEGSEVLIGGALVDEVSPEFVRAAGLRFVHQDSTMVPTLSVLENMSVGSYRTGVAGRIRWSLERASVQTLLDDWGIGVDARDAIGSLTQAQLAKLAVLRAIRRTGDEKIDAIILDEPTAALGRDDAREVLDWVKQLAVREQLGVLLISHRLDEILSVADTVAVLRSGRIVAVETAATLTHDRLVEHIVGGSLDHFYPERTQPDSITTALEVAHLSGASVNDLSFSVASGEVVGITGLPGSGFEDVPYLLIDPGLAPGGACTLGGQPLDLRSTSIRERVARGLVLVPADRKVRALATELSVRENISLPRLRSFVRGGLLRRSRETADAERLTRLHGISPSSSRTSASRLSGGNQQKVVLAKWLSTEPKVLLLHEPTQAVDVGAKADIFRLIADAAAAGMAAVIVSVEYEDLAHLCDRVLVLGDGRINAVLEGSELTPEAVTAAAFLAHTRRLDTPPELTPSAFPEREDTP